MQRGNEGLRQDTKTKQDHGKEIQSQTWKDSECLSYPKNFPFISLKIFFSSWVKDTLHVYIVLVYHFVEWRPEETKRKL